MRNRYSIVLLSSISFLSAEELVLEKITVSASVSTNKQSFELPCQIDSIKPKAKDSASLGETLSQITGVNSISTGTQAGNVAIRGLSGERIKVLSNGNPTDFQGYGIRHIANIDPALNENIEVIRGASGVLYGSNAMGGVVNVLSPSFLHTDENQTLFKGKINASYSTNNDEKAIALKTKSAIGKWGVNIDVSKREAGNYSTGDSKAWQKGTTNSYLPLFAGELPYTDFETKSARIGVGYKDDGLKASLQHTYWNSLQNYLGHTPSPDFEAVASAGQDLTNNETQLKLSKDLGEWNVAIKASKTHNQREASTNTPYQTMSSKKGTNDYLDIDTLRDDIGIEVRHPMIGDWIGKFGIDGYNKEQTLNDGKLVPSADEKGRAIYAFEEAEIGNWLFQGGLRYDKQDITASLDGTSKYFVDKGFYDATNNDRDFSSWGGSIGATYKFTPSWAIASNLSKGFRSPSIFELYAGGIHGGVQAFQIGNPNLVEEKNIGLDVSFRYLKDKTSSNLTFHRNSIDDYIYLENTGRKRNPNTGDVAPNGLDEMKYSQTDAMINGIEYSLQTPLTPTTMIKISAEYLDTKDKKNDTRLAYTPASNGSIGLTQELNDFWMTNNNKINLDMRYYHKQKVVNSKEAFAQYNSTPFGSADTSSYALFDLGYDTKLKIADKNVDFSIKTSNLFDRAYRNYLDTYKGYALGIGRDVKFSMSVPF